MSTRSIAETRRVRQMGLWFSGFLVFLLGLFIALSLTYNPRSRLFPLLVSIPSFLCAVLVFASYFSETASRAIRAFNAALFETDADILKEDTSELKENSIRRSVGWTIGALVAFYLFGFVSMTFVFVYAYLIVEGGHRQLKSVALAALTTVLMYVLFVIVFGVRLEGGVITVFVYELLGLA